MRQLGMGVMIRQLCGDGGRSLEAYETLLNKKLAGVSLRDNVIRLGLEDGRTVCISDRGQSCCENRYITTDDDLSYFEGSSIVDIDLGEHRTIDDGHGDEHEIQFLNVKTSKGVITFETHNEHNGYYGGFSVELSIEG